MRWYSRVVDRCLMGVKDRRADLETNMANTLRRLKATVESESTTDVERKLVASQREQPV
jgi:hypothetical protein